MQAKEFDEKFDKGEDVTQFLALEMAKRPAQNSKQKIAKNPPAQRATTQCRRKHRKPV